MLLLLVRLHRGSPHALGGGGGAAACMRACEKEGARGGPAHEWAHATSGTGWVHQTRVWEHLPMLAPECLIQGASKSHKVLLD
jgi:hypothetical protein